MNLAPTLASIDAVLENLAKLKMIMLANTDSLPTLDLLEDLFRQWKQQSFDICTSLDESHATNDAYQEQSLEVVHFTSLDEEDAREKPRDELISRDQLLDTRKAFLQEDFNPLSYSLRLSLQGLPQEEDVSSQMVDEDRRRAFIAFVTFRDLLPDTLKHLDVLAHEVCGNSFEIALTPKGELLLCNMTRKSKKKYENSKIRTVYADKFLEYKRNFIVRIVDPALTQFFAINTENKLVLYDINTSSSNISSLRVEPRKVYSNSDTVQVIAKKDGDFLALSTKGVVSLLKKTVEDYNMVPIYVWRPTQKIREEGFEFTCLCHGYGKLVIAAYSQMHQKVLLSNMHKNEVFASEHPIHHMEIIMFSYVRLLICIDYNGSISFFFLYNDRFSRATCKLKSTGGVMKETYDQAVRESISLILADYQHRLRERAMFPRNQQRFMQPPEENLIDLFWPGTGIGIGMGLNHRRHFF